MISALQNAARGMREAESRFAGAAGQVARLGSDPTQAGAPGDLSQTAADLVSARAGFEANAVVLRSADQMSRRLLDIRV